MNSRVQFQLLAKNTILSFLLLTRNKRTEKCNVLWNVRSNKSNIAGKMNSNKKTHEKKYRAEKINKQQNVSRYRKDKILVCMQRNIAANASCECKRVRKMSTVLHDCGTIKKKTAASSRQHTERDFFFFYFMLISRGNAFNPLTKGKIERLQLPCDNFVIWNSLCFFLLYNCDYYKIQAEKMLHVKASSDIELHMTARNVTRWLYLAG